MKVDYFNDLEGGINAIFSLKTEDVVRGVVIKYLDYFYPVAANNTSAIIDTKIEQAMDLVKSHLLYTVREEVEVLKLRISELLTRINQLEKENSFLKANATPEVLTALNTRSEEVQTDETSFSTGATPQRDASVPAVPTE